jgi:hypothetical protein
MKRISKLGTALAFLRSVFQFLITANVILSLLIIFTLTMEAKHSSEASVLTTVTRNRIPEEDNLHNLSNKQNSVALSPRANYTD